MKYPKINSLFLRDIDNIIIPTKYTKDEYKYLENNLWECTEKIDGTNTRIYISMVAGDDETPWLYGITIKGREEKSILPDTLISKIENKLSTIDWSFVFPNITPEDVVCLYGEGYGSKIQKNGNKYIKDDVDFILFDIRVNDWWLTRKDCEDIAAKCNMNIVPIIGYMTIPQAIEFVKKGFKSKISEDKDLDAEGLVLKTPYGLEFRNGSRIIAKIKHKDFTKFKAVYGDNPNPEQIENFNYK